MNAQKKDQAQIIAALKQYVDGRINETIERCNLRQRTRVGESFDDFLVSLRELATTCNFCNNDCLQKALCDQIIEGLHDGDIIQELLQVKDLTLDQAITKCRGLEVAKKSRTDIQGSVELNVARTNPLKKISVPVLIVATHPTLGVEKTAPHTRRLAVTAARQAISAEYVGRNPQPLCNNEPPLHRKYAH